jgi:DNA-binding MarR family transcriptional regulator
VEHLQWAGALDVLALADRAVTIAVAPAAARVGITLEQWRILARLDTEAGRTMSEIATDAGLSPSTATRLVDRLVLDGQAYRLNDSRDRRRVLVHISAQGRELLQLIAAEIQRRFGPVIPDDADGSPDRIGLLERIAFQADGPRPAANGAPQPDSAP